MLLHDFLYNCVYVYSIIWKPIIAHLSHSHLLFSLESIRSRMSAENVLVVYRKIPPDLILTMAMI